MWPRPGRLISRSVSAVLVGWLVVYNVMRVAGGTPAGVALMSFLIGTAAGIGVLIIGMWMRTRLIDAGRLHPVDPDIGVPDPADLSLDQRGVLNRTWSTVAVACVVQLIVGVLMLIDWNATPSASRATAELVVAVWFVFAAGWMGWEATNLRNGNAGGVDSVALGALLSTVLGGVAITRGFVASGQYAVVVLTGISSVFCYRVVWKFTRDRGVPWMAVIAGVIALAALIIPSATS